MGDKSAGSRYALFGNVVIVMHNCSKLRIGSEVCCVRLPCLWHARITCKPSEKISQSQPIEENVLQLLTIKRQESADAQILVFSDLFCSLRLQRLVTSLTRYNRRRKTSPGELDQTKLSYVRLVNCMDETYALSLILAHSLHSVKIWRHPQNRKHITYCTAVRTRPSHDTWYIIHERTERQTDRQTDTLIGIFRTRTVQLLRRFLLNLPWT